MRSRRTLLLATAGTLALLPAVAPAFPGKGEPESRLGAAREELGEPAPPAGRFDLPGGELQVTPTQVLASRSGQRLRFTVTLDRPAAGASLRVTLPRRWVDLPASRLPAVRGLRERGPARLRRAGREVALTFDDAPAGTTASFEVADNGIPAGTYPLAFRWVDATGRTRKAGTARIAFLAPSREALTTGLAAPGIAGNVTNDSLEESETFLTAVPGDKDRVLVGINWPNPSMAAWLTDNGGGSWVSRTLPETLDAPGKATPENGSICCDPMSVADARGNVWFGGVAFDPPGSSVPGRVVVNRVAAGSTTFQPQTVGLPARTSDQDKPMMTLDNGPLSPTFGRLYVVWNEITNQGAINVVISQCDTRANPASDPSWCDNADHWTTPVSVTPSGGSYIYADAAVGPDGRVYVTWWDFSNVNAIRGDVCDPSSQNCAAASGWGTPQTIALLDSTGGQPVPFACPILAQPGGRAAPSPSVDIDRSGGASDGRVYVAWGDLRPGSGTTRCADNQTPLSTHLTWDSFAASAPGGALPGGASPSASVGSRLLSDGEGGGQANSDDWFPWLAVDQTTGQAWANLYSTRDFASRQKTNFYARSLTPSGGSLAVGSLTKVSSGASDYSAEPCCSFGNDYGDYTGLDATSGRVYPVWSDNGSGGGDGEAFAFIGQPATPQSPTPVTGTGSDAGQRTATLNGTLNAHGQTTSYHFEYSTGLGYTTSTPAQSLAAGSSDQPVSAPVTGLDPATTYHYRLVASNASGAAAGTDGTVTTAPALPPAATTGAASSVGSGAATLNGTVNPRLDPTTYRFEYGTTTAYGTQTAPQDAGAGNSNVAAATAVSGLQPDTTYHFRIVATNATGTTNGSDQTLTTAAPPTAITGAASSVAQRSSTVNGTVNPNGRSTTYSFEYGTTQLYGSTTTAQSAGSGTSPQAVSAGLTGLTPGTEYHYRVVSVNDAGTTQGDDMTFTTAPALAPGATTEAASGVGTTTATVHATVNPNLDPTTYRFEYGTASGVYDQQTAQASAGAGDAGVAVSANLSNLASGTQYYFRVVAANASGTTQAAELTFTTDTPPPQPEPPAVTTGSASDITDASTTLGGTVDPKGQSTTYRFDYGTQPGVYTAHVDGAAPVTGSSAQPVSAPVAGLDPSTTYHFRLSATNDAGTTNGLEQSFTTNATPPPPPPGPSAATLAATDVGPTGATLHGTVAEATEYRFQYGAGGSLDLATSFVPVGASAVSAIVSGLSPGTTYSFRVQARNGKGDVASGQTLQFTTAALPPPTGAGSGENPPPAGQSPAATGQPTTPAPAGTGAPVAPAFSLSLPRQRPAGVSRRGLLLTVRCRAACRLLGRLYLDPRNARRIGLGRRTRTLLVATARASATGPGSRRLRLRLSPRVARAIRGAATVALELHLRAADATGRRSRTRAYRATLRRRGPSPVVRGLALTRAP